MPLYEYACDACHHQFEKLQKISAAPLSDCPACGESALKKLISASSFQFKGSGFYATDYKKTGSDKPSNGHQGADSAADKPQHSSTSSHTDSTSVAIAAE